MNEPMPPEDYPPAPKTVAVVGSRDWTDWKAVWDFVLTLRNGADTVLSGGCPSGVDRYAKEAARDWCPYREIAADWSQGKKAGPLRNEQIVLACDEMHAFWTANPKLPGTWWSMWYARKHGRPLTVHLREGQILDAHQVDRMLLALAPRTARDEHLRFLRSLVESARMLGAHHVGPPLDPSVLDAGAFVGETPFMRMTRIEKGQEDHDG